MNNTLINEKSIFFENLNSVIYRVIFMVEEKKAQLIMMLSDFCDEKLDDEIKELSVKLVEKMSRKHVVPFRRGKLENWASGIIYAIAQINFLFDKSSEIHTSPDEICNYFKTKKSTASNKARDIRKMFDLGHFDNEFSTRDILHSQPVRYIDENGFIVPEEFLINNSQLEELMDRIVQYGNVEIPDELNIEFLTKIVNSTLFCAPFFEGVTLLQTDCDNKFFPFFTSRQEYFKTFPDDDSPVPFSFYDFCEMAYDLDGQMGFEGVKLNPDTHNLFISCEMMMGIYEMFE